jgi:hypothetical protein
MCGAIPLLPQYVFMAWCLGKHRDNFTFYVFLCLFFNANGWGFHFYPVSWHVDLCCSWWRMTMTGTVLSAMQVVMWSVAPVVIVCTMCLVLQRRRCFKKMWKTHLFVQYARWCVSNVYLHSNSLFTGCRKTSVIRSHKLYKDDIEV